jgi:hypothetical protein
MAHLLAAFYRAGEKEGMQVVCLQLATAALIIPDHTFYQCMEKMRRVAPRLRNPFILIHNVFRVYGMPPEFRGFGG